jgi:GcrA cell cycle regulator
MLIGTSPAELWTVQRTELLTKLWSDGLSASQIAAELGGITRNAVIGKVHRLGLPGHLTLTGPTELWTVQRTELLTKLWSDGLSASRIAAELGGITRNTVIGKVHRLGLPKRAKKAKPWVVAGVHERTWHRRQAKARQRPFVLDEARFWRDIALDLPPAVPPATAVSIGELEDHHCRWPLGEPGADMLYCGADKVLAVSYCPFHHALAYTRRASYYLRKQEYFNNRRLSA